MSSRPQPHVKPEAAVVNWIILLLPSKKKKNSVYQSVIVHRRKLAVHKERLLACTRLLELRRGRGKVALLSRCQIESSNCEIQPRSRVGNVHSIFLIYKTCVVRWEVVPRALIWTSLLLGSLVCQEFRNVCTSHPADEKGAALVTLQWYSNFRNRKTNSTKLNAETKFTSLNPMSILHSQAMLRPFKCCVQSRAMGSHIESSFSTYLRHGVILTERLCFCIL